MRRRGLLRWTFVALVLGAAYIALASIEVSAPVTSERLAASLTDASGSVGGLLGDNGTCRTGSRRGGWRCDVVDSEGSGGATYRVDVPEEGSCWEARIVADFSEGGMPARVSGCVERHLLPLPDLL